MSLGSLELTRTLTLCSLLKAYKGSHVGSLNFRGDGQESKSPEGEGNVALIFSAERLLGWVGRGHVSIFSIKRC